MTRKAGESKPSAGVKALPPQAWISLTWNDLDRWAGARSVSRGRTYARQGHVEDLAISAEGRLLATVVGAERYITSAWHSSGKKKSPTIQSRCTCPVGHDGCKHGVALVAAYLQALADQTPVAQAEDDDLRWVRLASHAGDTLGDVELDDDEDEEAEKVEMATVKGRRTGRGTPADWDQKIQEYLRGQSADELVKLVLSLTERFPELRGEFQERIALREGDVSRLVKQARQVLREVTAETGWRNRWDDEGHTPDYSGLRNRLDRLLEGGHFDEVAALGRELFERGMVQVEQSHDDGDTSMALAECLAVVFRAVAGSRLSATEKILYAIDVLLSDDYDILNDEAGPVLDGPWTPTDWSGVADALRERLRAPRRASGGSDLRDYQRDRVTGWLLTALDHAGRDSESLAVLEAEATTTGSYERLVRHLIAQGRLEDAERWAQEGIEATRAKLPGIAASLARLMCEVARGRKQWTIVAAHAGVDFLEHPSAAGFAALMEASRKAKCEGRVREAAMRFLETGESLIPLAAGGKNKTQVTVAADWPLPMPEYLRSILLGYAVQERPRQGAYFHVLLEIALAEKRTDDVIKWYDRMQANPSGADRWSWAIAPTYAGRVAAAVAKSHPDRAVKLYTDRLAAHLTHAKQSDYDAAAATLRDMRPIMKKLGEEQAWEALLEGIRLKHRNRPRLMEALDRLDGRPIVESEVIRKRPKR